MKVHTTIGIHFGTFPLADDGQNDPLKYLAEALAETDLGGTEFITLDFGEGRSIPPVGEGSESLP